MRTALLLLLVGQTIVFCRLPEPPQESPKPMNNEVGLVVVDPGHFHAALVEKDMYPQVSPRVSVYAPLGPDLLDYLNRMSLFNRRAGNPTRWELDVHTGPDFLDRMLREHPGNVAVFAGRNREKIGRILRSLEAGYNVLADKPWIIASADLPKLAAALDLAERKGLVAYDIMTERYEITSILQKEIVNTPEVFGHLVQGSEAEPAVRSHSIHRLMKVVAGVPLRRPAWFFDVEEAGEGLSDVGTHLVDLVQWTAFPSEPVDYRSEVEILGARRWPTTLTREQFTQVTGEPDFPPFLSRWIQGGEFQYYCNDSVNYRVRGVHVSLQATWDWQAPPGAGDIYEATFRGTLARAEIRQGREEKFRPELYIRPNTPEIAPQVFAALKKKYSIVVADGEARILIPEDLRVGHESHFAQVTRAFLGYLGDPRSLPAWEKSNMLVKYFVTTKAVDLARR